LLDAVIGVCCHADGWSKRPGVGGDRQVSGRGAGADVYDRQLLLFGSRRNAVLDLSEVLRYGTDSYGNPDYVSIYGLPPAQWYARGIRVLGRTAVECTRDQLADAIGRDIEEVASSGPGAAAVTVIDPFAGSANTLYWILRHLPRARCVGFELDAQVCQLTQQTLSILALPLEIRHADYVTALSELTVSTDQLVVAFIAPPWGDALSASDGLDLRLTRPPARDIMDLLTRRFPNPLLFAIQVYEQTVPASTDDLTSHLDWSALHVYEFNKPGQNHGLLLATRGWRPRSAA
jgi:hypothetical protein